MTRFQFTIIDYTINPAGDNTVIDEPVGWDGLRIKLFRHKKWHGFFDYFDSGISPLQFDGIGFGILKNAWETKGVAANVVLKIDYRCSDTDSFEELYNGLFNFNLYERHCGDRCYIEIHLDAASCIDNFINRVDQQVNLDSLRTFDLPEGDADDLSAYAGLGFEMLIEPNQIYVQSAWGGPQTESITTNYVANTTVMVPHYYRPGFLATQSDIPETISSGVPDSDPVTASPPYSVMLGYIEVENQTNINVENVTITFDLEGTFRDLFVAGDTGGTVASSGGNGIQLQFEVGASTLSSVVEWQENNVVLPYSIGSGADHVVAFDTSGSFIIASIPAGKKLFIYFLYQYEITGVSFGTFPTLDRKFEWEYTKAEITASAFISSSPTLSRVNLVNETASRISEIITGDCLRVYSDYFGRTDAEPYPSDVDGCAGLEVVTNGLNIRRAITLLIDENNQKSFINPEYRLSMKQLFDGLNAIHNIGMGAEDDPNRPGYQLLRIEKFQHFYQDTVLISLDKIAEVEASAEQPQLYSIYKGGYEKSETETLGGRYDIQGKRDFRTTLKSVFMVLEKVCPFIASGHSIEVTRWQIGNTSQDWRYDNDTFIMCVKRDLEALNGYLVERGNDGTAINLPNWETVYNIRITPQRNARRWVPIVFQCYVDYVNGMLVFMDGTGNLVAKTFIQVNDADCQVELFTVPFTNTAENSDIDYSKYDPENVASFYPIFKPERVTFEYPLSFAQWKTLKANPTGLIAYQCGSGPVEQGWIDEVNYIPAEGMADFTLIPRMPFITLDEFTVECVDGFATATYSGTYYLGGLHGLIFQAFGDPDWNNLFEFDGTSGAFSGTFPFPPDTYQGTTTPFRVISASGFPVSNSITVFIPTC